MSPSGQETVLYSFMNGVDGGFPSVGVVRDAAGNLYGTASAGGAYAMGVVFKLNPTGVETVLYSFTGGSDGYDPGGLILDPAGNLYGTTEAGCGTAYKLDPSGNITILYTFMGADDGCGPVGSLALDEVG